MRLDLEGFKAVKKPVEIDAFEWITDGVSLQKWVESFGDNFSQHFEMQSDATGHSIEVKTLEGTSYKVPFRYIIIRGVKGEYYPCEPKIFAETYTRIQK